MIITIIPLLEYFENTEHKLSCRQVGVEANWLATDGRAGKVLADSPEEAIEHCLYNHHSWVSAQDENSN